MWRSRGQGPQPVLRRQRNAEAMLAMMGGGAAALDRHVATLLATTVGAVGGGRWELAIGLWRSSANSRAFSVSPMTNFDYRPYGEIDE